MKRSTSKRSKLMWRYLLIFILFAVIIFIELEQQNKEGAASVPTVDAAATLPLTSTSPAASQEPMVTLPARVSDTPTALVSSTPLATVTPLATRRPLPTDLPGLEITPMRGTLYEVTGSVNALGCPDSRCKVRDVYKKRNIIVVTGTVMGTTYKAKKTRIWYQVIFHDGSKVYVHGSFVKPHEAWTTN